MNILGVSFGYHDSTSCLVKDGVVACAISEDRLTRQKHDSNFPRFSIDYCLKSNDLELKDIDFVVYHEDPYNKFSRVLSSSLSGFPFTHKEFAESTKSWMSKKLWVLDELNKKLDIPTEKIIYLGHHYSHALQAFIGSGYKESAVLIVDAVGDWSSSSMFQGKWVDGKPVIEQILEIAFPHSLGLVYSAVTAFLGFNPNDSECSTMALASFGKPMYIDEFRKIIKSNPESIYEIDQSYFNFFKFYRGPVTKKFKKLFGKLKDQNNKYTFDSFKSFEENSTTSDQHYADIACSLQVVLEERILEMATYIQAKTNSENLCYAGGVSMNCVANTKILESDIFKNIFIPPEPGDGGTCVGASLFIHAQNKIVEDPATLKYWPYLGSEYQSDDALEMVEHLNFKYINDYLATGVPHNIKWNIIKVENEDELVKKVAGYIKEGHITAWFQGASEIGPRALGNRSIIFKANDLDLARRVSTIVKTRASFRPYALSMTFEEANRLLECENKYFENYRWMQYTAKIKKEFIEELRAGLHVDLTSRVQICSSEDNPLYHNLLSEYQKVSGMGSFVNTSFNMSGYPMVNLPSEALAMFARTDIDYLVLGNNIVEKVKA